MVLLVKVGSQGAVRGLRTAVCGLPNTPRTNSLAPNDVSVLFEILAIDVHGALALQLPNEAIQPPCHLIVALVLLGFELVVVRVDTALHSRVNDSHERHDEPGDDRNDR